MLKEIRIKNIKTSDRVFECENTLVKVRLLKKEISQQNKIFGPSAVSLQLSFSICDQKGKAIPGKDGRFSILPHNVTVPMADVVTEATLLRSGLDEIIEPLIKKTVVWHKSLMNMDTLLGSWEDKNPGSKASKKSHKI